MKKHIVRPNGTQHWWRDGKLHREDGPAIVWADGSQEWWRNGKRHRSDGPAIVWVDGTQEWYRNGARHRLDGPAVINTNGSQEWWLEGDQITKPILTKVSPTVVSIFGPVVLESYKELGCIRDGMMITFPTEEDALLWYLREKC